MSRKLLQLAFIACTVFTVVSSAPTAKAETAPKRIEISAKRFTFTPDTITLKKGEPVILVLKSEDVAHGVKIREFNVEIKAKPHETAEVRFTPDKTGDFVGHCSVFCGTGHGSMMLRLHVVD